MELRQAGLITSKYKFPANFIVIGTSVIAIISSFNIEIDLSFIFLKIVSLLEVFTSVPPDPVSIVHYRHWVV
jgi:hypothetical protein